MRTLKLGILTVLATIPFLANAGPKEDAGQLLEQYLKSGRMLCKKPDSVHDIQFFRHNGNWYLKLVSNESDSAKNPRAILVEATKPDSNTGDIAEFVSPEPVTHKTRHGEIVNEPARITFTHFISKNGISAFIYMPGMLPGYNGGDCQAVE